MREEKCIGYLDNVIDLRSPGQKRMDELTVVDIAKSLYSLCCQLGVEINPEMPEPMPWDGLAFDKQSPWIFLATRGPRLLERLEGQKLSVVAFHVFEMTCSDDEKERADEIFNRDMGFKQQLMWEAIARHLFVLMDSEDAALDPGGAERMHLEWFRKKAHPHILVP